MAQPKRAATLARWGTTLVMHAEDRPDCALGTHESLRQQRGSAIAMLAFKRTQESASILRRNHLVLIVSKRGQEQDARPRVLEPGVVFCVLIREVGRFLPESLSVPW